MPMCQFLSLSTSLLAPIQGIIARSWAPVLLDRMRGGAFAAGFQFGLARLVVEHEVLHETPD